jgi:DnaK suppressor protein
MENYKTKLEEEKNILIEELSGISKKNETTNRWEAVTSDAGVTEPDPSDMSDRGEEYEERSSLVKVLEKRLESVEGALIKIENGTFGKCEIDQMQIEEDRLEANPSAATCKKCM